MLTTQLQQCSRCKSVLYCSSECQQQHWPNHKNLCKAIGLLAKAEQARNYIAPGDSSDEHVFPSHITPKQQARVARLVGNKCSVHCRLNGKSVTALWDTGAQVSMISEDFLQNQLLITNVNDIKDLLGVKETIKLQAANGTPIPYSGWVELKVKLESDDNHEILVPFLITKQNIGPPIIGFNVIELIVKEATQNGDTDHFVASMKTSFDKCKSENITALISLMFS